MDHQWRTAAIQWDHSNGPIFTFDGTCQKTSKLENLGIFIMPVAGPIFRPLSTRLTHGKNREAKNVFYPLCFLEDSLSSKSRERQPMQFLGCDNGGGGGNFSKGKRLVAKWIGTRKWLFSGFWTARA